MKRKLIVTLGVLVVIIGIFIFDSVRSTMFNMELISISPSPIAADGQTEAKIVVRLKNHDGKPVKGHNLFALPVGGGVLRANRETTDSDGKVVFSYFPYKASELVVLKDVELRVIDESNSIFFEVNTKNNFILKLSKPKQETEKSIDTSDIFGQ